jgi:hydrogenase maturation protein HypF
MAEIHSRKREDDPLREEVETAAVPAARLQRLRIRIRGIVQGVGFRPFVYRIARKYSISGSVANDTLGVLIEAEGAKENISHFLAALTRDAPPLARIESVKTEDLRPLGEKRFSIGRSSVSEQKEALIPPDISTCTDCLREIFDPEDRRFRYPFTNCTNCGPRYTIVRDIPYDRPRTSMSAFKMCRLCQKEYDLPEDRRFHAQPNACAVCGPHLTLTDNKRSPVKCADPIQKVVELLKNGAIVALRGVGGFHLSCDATSDDAVRKLRRRKQRPRKPFAIMSQDVETVSQYAFVSDAERGILESFASPIVLLRKKDASYICGEVAPGISELGVMLPYTPLHHLLVRNNFLALVMTSGNLQDEPTIASNEEAYEKLSRIADYFLIHNREILIQNDDSIVKFIGGEPVVMRRARGYVPQMIQLPFEVGDLPDILAVGAEEKGTVCFVKGGRAFLSQHLGDLKNKESVLSFENTVRHMERILAVKPRLIAHDLHPVYASTKFAKAQRNAERVPVQHHFAHIASCLAENGIDEKVIGVSFDGVGLGSDGNSWGGEFLIADLSNFERAGHLEYVCLPGADAAAREPYRMAVSYLHNAFGWDALRLAHQMLAGVEGEKIEFILNLLKKRINSPLTSSVGRLFDAVASLIGLCQVNTYEGQAPMELESLIYTEVPHNDAYPYRMADRNGALVVDFAPAIQSIVADRNERKSGAHIACKFHNTVAEFAVEVCEMIRSLHGLGKVALSGGVFQNKYLSERLTLLLERGGFTVYKHRNVPPNDGGISLGQAAVAAYRYRKAKR